MNVPFSIEEFRFGGERVNSGGGWLTALLGRMLKDTDSRFACVAFGKYSKVDISSDERIQSFVIPKGLSKNEKGLRRCCDLVNEWKPDLIHIHGTEGVFGLLPARCMVKCPAVISLQGLLGPYSEWYHYFGKASIIDLFRMHRWIEIPLLRGQWIMYYGYIKAAKREREIIAGNRFFIGRTAWDRAYLKAQNSSAQYFYGGELLREAFWRKSWDLKKIQPHRIIFTNAGHPRKGTEILLDAVKLLQPHFSNIQVCVAGGISHRSGYGRYIRRQIRKLGHSAIELGPLNAKEMAIELARSHVFVSPSYIDNSPNAICEAQLLGMPVISTYTGGVPSLIDDGRTGLLFPTGDAPMLAYRLREVLENEEMAARLGRQAHAAAVTRHDPRSVVNGILEIYEKVLRSTKT
jgi:glycosyltransferase involved in cell wall biosynthesis